MDTEMSECYRRNLEDVELVIGHAKLEDSELRPLTQVLYMSDVRSEYKLIEMDSQILQNLKQGQEVVFRGQKDDRAVLCTEEMTYEVKEAETSNSLLLTPRLLLPDQIPISGDVRSLEEKQIAGIFHDYYELRVVKPKLGVLRSLLTRNSFEGSELETETRQSDAPTTDELLSVVQASRQELTECLKHINALQISGKWRVLGFDYEFRCLSFLLNLIEENSWSLDEIQLGESLNCLSELMPKEVLHYIVETYLNPSGELNDDGEELYSLERRKVSRLLAEALLRPVERFNLHDFLQAWQQSVPEGIETDVGFLGGLALIQRESKPQVIRYLPESGLSEEVQERFGQLFGLREKWTLDQIAPYIEPLLTGKQTVNGLLTKFSRASHTNGIKYFSSRHGK